MKSGREETERNEKKTILHLSGYVKYVMWLGGESVFDIFLFVKTEKFNHKVFNVGAFFIRKNKNVNL